MCAWQNIWKIQKTPTSDIRVTHIATPQDNLLDSQNLKIKVQVKLAPETWREDRVVVECVCVCVCVCVSVSVLSLAWLFETPWTGAHQISLHMEFPRKEYWSGLPFLSPGALPDSGIEPTSLASPALSGWFFTTAAAKLLQLCPTLCDPIDGSPLLPMRNLSLGNCYFFLLKISSDKIHQHLETKWKK